MSESNNQNKRVIADICGAVHNPEQFPTVIETCKGCDYYAYIFHDKDIDDNGNLKPIHLHFVCHGRHYLSQWAKLLGIPENMIEIVRNTRGVNRYLIHLDDPEKYQYSPSDVITNKSVKFKMFLEDNQELKPIDLFNDLQRLKERRITKQDFINKYQFFIYKQSFLSQYKILTDLINNYD